MRRLRVFLAISLAACGGADPEPVPELAPRPSLESVPSTRLPRPLCGDEHEATIRALVPALGACGTAIETAYVVVRLGRPVVVATRVANSELEAFIANDAGLLDALPEVVPATPVDAEALLAAAILARHGSPRVFVARDTLPPEAARHVGPLGHDGAHLRALGLREADETWRESIRYDATFLPSGGYRIDETRLLFTDDGRARVPSNAALPALAATPAPRDVCGSPDEIAIRGRLVALPPCAPTLAAVYAVAGTTDGQLLVVSWRDDRETPPRRETRVIHREAIDPRMPTEVHPAPPSESEAILRLAVLAAHHGPELALDRRSLRGFLDDGPELGEVPRTGISHERGLVRLVALGTDVVRDESAAYWTVTRYESTLTTDGALATETRVLVRRRRVRIETDDDD